MSAKPLLAPRPSHLPRLQLGWPLSPTPIAGSLLYPDLDRSIRDQIKVILLTQPGEMLLQPSFGAGLEVMLHQPNTLGSRRRIRDLVQKSVDRWERRIMLDAVDVWEIEGRPDAVRVELAYRIKRTGTAHQFHFDFALGS
ncbi:GPW/gp25 family protein [Parerythrobacter aestuarii]|uniref:GPW/gp25 family protein n=1 Tax=Parerythrobacter aestuarii TaxID=3020909 RepID=UPI0024DEA882|nr:GPW/gp25 family protein [Parerythrobacter aestuarii]